MDTGNTHIREGIKERRKDRTNYRKVKVKKTQKRELEVGQICSKNTHYIN